MSYTTIDYRVADHVATITLDRPERLNAFTVRMQQELCAAVDEVDADEAVRAVVVTGRGRGFCAGADLGGGDTTFDTDSDVATGGGVVREADGRHRDEGGLTALRFFECTKPVIGAINGAAVGVGPVIHGVQPPGPVSPPGVKPGMICCPLTLRGPA